MHHKSFPPQTFQSLMHLKSPADFPEACCRPHARPAMLMHVGEACLSARYDTLLVRMSERFLTQGPLPNHCEQSFTLLALPMAGAMLSGSVMSTWTSCTRLLASAGSSPKEVAVCRYSVAFATSRTPARTCSKPHQPSLCCGRRQASENVYTDDTL